MQEIPTKLSLVRFFQIMGINPLHGQGVYLESMARNANRQLTCGQPIFQFEWQNSDAVGREEIARAIFEAETDLENVIGYRLLPTWEEDEWVHTVRPFRKEMTNQNSRDIRGLSPVIVPRWGYMLSGGIRSVETLLAEAAITYMNDRPPAAYNGLATVMVALAAELPDCEIALYYPGHAGDERWRITPIVVSHDLVLNYTITFRREQAIVESAIQSYDLQELRGLDGLDDVNFLTTVDVCRVYNDPQQQATMLWEGSPGCPSCGSAGTDCQTCGYSTATACLSLRGDPRLSQLVYRPATWDADALAFSQDSIWARSFQPDILRLWYYAGWRDKRATCPATELDADWARTIAYMAAARLSRPICACATPSTEYWGADLAFAGGVTEKGIYRTTERDLGNPFGTRRGEVMAWRRVNQPGAAIRGVVANTAQ